MAQGTYGHCEVSPGDSRHIDSVTPPDPQGLVAGVSWGLTLTAGGGNQDRAEGTAPGQTQRNLPGGKGGEHPLIDGEEVQLAVHVHGEGFPQVAQLLQGLVDEDDADEGGEGLLGEAGDVAHQAAGVRGHQHHAEERGPEPDARPQGQVGERIFPGKAQNLLGKRSAQASELSLPPEKISSNGGGCGGCRW